MRSMISPASRAPIAASGSSSAGDGDGLALAAGEALDGEGDGGDVDADLLEAGFGLAAHGAVVKQAERAGEEDFAVEEQVVVDAERVGEGQVLVDALDAERAAVVDGAEGDFFAGDEEAALGGGLEAGQDLHQS